MFDMAAPEYERYLNIYPGGTDRQTALFRLGESYRTMGSVNAAKAAYYNLLSSFATGEFIGPAAYRLADLYYEEKDFNSALPLYRKAGIRLKDPTVANAAKFYTARCLENLRLTIEARQAYEDVAAIKQDNPFREAARFAVAQMLLNSQRKEEAVREFDALAKDATKPELKVEALVKAGLLKIEMRQPQQGAADLTKALQMPEIGQWKTVAQTGLMRVRYEEGKYKELIEAYNSGANDFPAETKAEAALLAANANRQLGQHKEARALYEQITRDYPDSLQAKDARYERLVSLYAANDPDVVKEADDFLAQPQDAFRRDQVILLKAESLYKQQKYSEAAPVYAALEGSRLIPSLKADALFKLGWCCVQMKDSDRAIQAFSDFLKNYPTNKLAPTALAQRAVAYQQTKNLPAALKDFSELIATYPKARERELALQQKALILGQQQDNPGMATTFRQLLKEFPKSPAAAQANYWIGWAAFEVKDYRNAPAPLEAARKLDKEQFFERATLRIMLSHYYLEERDPTATEADACLKSGKGKVPSEVLRWLGTQFLTDQSYDKAEKYLSALTQRTDEITTDDWLNLGRSQLYQRDLADAVISFQKYLDAVKQPFARATGLLALGQAQLGLNQFDAAQKSADDACFQQPEGRVNAEGRMLSGDIAMARGEYDKASKVYLSIGVVFDDPQFTPEALEKACDALRKAGNGAEAAKTLNKLQSQYPEYKLKGIGQP